MNQSKRYITQLIAAAAVAAAALCHVAVAPAAQRLPAAAAYATPWNDAPYSYDAERVPLKLVLEDFGRHFGVSTRVDASLVAIVNGRVSAATPSRFLDELAGPYGFDWYFSRGILYVSPVTRRVDRVVVVPRSVIAQVKPALRDMGVYDPRFGWGQLPGEGSISVSGPPSYVEQVEKAIRGMTSVSSRQKLAVFRLRYASVQDRIIAYRDKEISVPGVATMVQRLAADSMGAVPGGGPPRQSMAVIDPGTGMPQPDAPGSLERPQRSPMMSGLLSGVVVEADVRLNALIVKAPEELLPLYEQLVHQLDVAVPLVQIEATIIEVDNSGGEELGVDWGASSRRFNAEINNSGAASGIGLGQVLRGAAPTAAISTILPGNLDLMARVHALQQKGKAWVVSSPSILSMDNTTALLDLSETYYIRNHGERVVETLPVSVGLMLKVIPHVVASRSGEAQRIMLQLDIEDGKRTDESVENVPIVKRNVISTQALVNDGDSLMIAGHQRNETERRIRQVPLLGSLPWIGGLFRYTGESHSRRTRYFVITPRVVDGATLPAGAMPGESAVGARILPGEPGVDERRLAGAVLASRAAIPPPAIADDLRDGIPIGLDRR